MGPQPGDQTKHGGFPAAGRAEDADELAVVRPVFDDKTHIANSCGCARGARVESLGDVLEFDDVGGRRRWLTHLHPTSER
jgi:hypothetical protein